MGIVILGKEITLKKLVVFLGGLALLALGMTLFMKTSLGAEPWALLYAGVSGFTGLDVGLTIQLIGIAMVLLVCVSERSLPKPGTLASFIVIGLFANFFAGLGFNFSELGFLANLAAFITAVITASLGLGLYVAADLGEGNIELLQFFLAGRLKKNITAVRVVMDCSAALLGFLLGGPLGVGTVISAFAIGPLLTFFLNLSRRYLFPEHNEQI